MSYGEGMRICPLLIVAALLVGCTKNGTPAVQTDTEYAVDCVQGGMGRIDLNSFTVGHSSDVWALGGIYTEDGTHTLSGFPAEDLAPIEPPLAVQLPDGALHFPTFRRQHLIRGTSHTYWLDDDLVLWETTDGAQWEPKPPAVPVEPRHHVSGEAGIVAHGQRLVLWQTNVEDSAFLSNDGGATWRNLPMPQDPNVPVNVVGAAVGPDGRVAVTTSTANGPGLYLSVDDGQTFERYRSSDQEETWDYRETFGGFFRMAVTEDGALWIYDRLDQGNDEAAAVVLYRSEDWSSFTTGGLTTPPLQDLLADYPDLVNLAEPWGPFTGLQTSGNRVFWAGGVGGPQALAPWYERELPFGNSHFCVAGLDTLGAVTPEFPVAPPATFDPGSLHAVRRYNTHAVGVADSGRAVFGEDNPDAGVWGLYSTGGPLWSDTGLGYITDVVRRPGADYIFVLAEPDDIGINGGGATVPVIAKIDLATGNLLDTHPVGPFNAIGNPSEQWVESAVSLRPSPWEWPMVETTSGIWRPGDQMDYLNGVPWDVHRPYTVDQDTQDNWFYEDGWLHKTTEGYNLVGSDRWTSTCDRLTETADCFKDPHALQEFSIHDGVMYVLSDSQIHRRTLGASGTWEHIVTGAPGPRGLHVEDRSDGLKNVWFIADKGALFVTVPDGSGPQQFGW